MRVPDVAARHTLEAERTQAQSLRPGRTGQNGNLVRLVVDQVSKERQPLDSRDRDDIARLTPGPAHRNQPAAGGEAGLERALELLRREISATMANVGARTIAELTPGLVVPSFAPPAAPWPVEPMDLGGF